MKLDAIEMEHIAAAEGVARVNLYAGIHKGLRALLSKTLLAVGRMDPQDAAEVAATTTQVAQLLDLCASHVVHEDTFIHTAIEARAPGASSAIGHDHRGHEIAIEALRALAARLGATPAPQRAGVARSLYLQLSRFVGHNLEHMYVEETAHNAVLWAHYTDSELVAIHAALVASIPPGEMMFSMAWMLPSLSAPERVDLLADMRANAPAPAFGAVMALARAKLDDAQWRELNRRLDGAPAA